MISDLYKRILIFGSLMMAMAILAPSLIKLGHTLYEHSQEKHCVAYGTNHIHDADLDCDFHDFTLVNKVLINTSFNYIPVEIPTIKYTTSVYTYIYKPKEVSFRALRGPPAVS
ncbi:hypothetical protein [Flagellimonas crocea]|uniref:hypothetical protein n=1 Tax=Flagellimonas crocea TaxID=3067311 RepID=UPI00296EF219|nr:hypothetical protein [Muricauda sp. DH64]